MDLNSQHFRILGSIAISIVGLQLVRKVLPWLYLYIIRPKFFGPKVNVRQLGEWAVITGATDGIGKSYAKALAKQNMNLVLISRTLTKLETVANEIGQIANVKIIVIDVDFTEGPEIFDKIQKRIAGLDIGVLVNNVGISYPYPEYFVECSTQNPKFLRDIIAANIQSVVQMCALILPDMVKKRSGAIINLSSTSAVIPNALLTVYSATKAFVNKFSMDLQTEYESQGVIVQSVQPGFVATNMTKIRKPSLFAPSADTYVASALSTLGVAGQTAGYLPHSLLQLAIHSVSAVAGEQFARKTVFKSLLTTRNRALRNAAKKQ